MLYQVPTVGPKGRQLVASNSSGCVSDRRRVCRLRLSQWHASALVTLPFLVPHHSNNLEPKKVSGEWWNGDCSSWWCVSQHRTNRTV